MPSALKKHAYDIVICGGGTAGCVLAARLSADPSLSVLLIEAGENANEDSRISTPGLATLTFDDPGLDWKYIAEPSAGLDGRQIALPRGKCLGGSSAINLLALIPPSKTGMDTWAELGNPGWEWDGLAPYFKKYHTHCPPSDAVKDALALDCFDPALLGTHGPIKSSYPTAFHPLQKAWIDTWKTLHHVATGDPLSGVATGGFTSAVAVDPATGTRSHSGVAYLQPVMGRKNLEVVTSALVEKVQLTKRDGEIVATGVAFSQHAQTYIASATKEVILCAGVFGSAQLLEISGIGDVVLHETLGIENIVDNKYVGENFQDHVMCGSSFELKDGITTADSMRDPAFAQRAMEEYQTNKSGPLSQGGGYSFAFTPLTDFLAPDPKDELSDLFAKYIRPDAAPGFPAERQHYNFARKIVESPNETSNSLCFLPVQWHPQNLAPSGLFSPSDPGSYVSVLTQLSHPFSRGSSHITSADIRVKPKIVPNYLEHPLDVEISARHLMQVETIVKTEPLKSFLKPNGRRMPDGYHARTLSAAKDFVRAASISNYHCSGTCAMMPRDLGGVVNERLIVHGTKNLRVVDASVFPIEPRGNIQSTVYAVAEKGADLILEDLVANRLA